MSNKNEKTATTRVKSAKLTNKRIKDETTTTVTNEEDDEEDKLKMTTPPTSSDEIKQMVGGCCVCGDDIAFDNNLLVYCDGVGCQVAVHQGCYGIVNIPDGDWYCKRCEYIKRNGPDIDNQICCMLCPIKEGALKRTENGKWAHVICGLYIPEISFGSVKTMEPIITKDIRLERLDKKCSICELNQSDVSSTDSNTASSSSHATPSLTTSNENNTTLANTTTSETTINTTTSTNSNPSSIKYTSGHVCVQCNNKTGCKLWFHVTCAQMSGLLCEDLSSASSNSVTYSVYCKNHFKSSNSEIRRIPAFNMLSSKTTNSSSYSTTLSKVDKQKQKDSKRKTSNTNLTTAATIQTQDSSTNITKKKTRLSNVLETTNSEKQNQTISKDNKDKRRTSRSNSSLNETQSSKETLNVTTNKKQRTNSVTSNDLKAINTKTDAKKTQPINKTSKPLVKSELSEANSIPLSIKDEIKQETPLSDTTELVTKTEETTTTINLIKQETTNDLTSKRKLRCSISEELEIQTPTSTLSSSSSSSSSSTSAKSPALPTKRPRNKSAETTHLKHPNQPLTPPPSVSQESNSHANHTNHTNHHDTNNFEVKSSKNSNNAESVLPKCSKQQQQQHQQSNDFPKTLEELLLKQWELGAELISEQSKKFDVFNLLNILQNCKKENDELEKKIHELEKTQEHLLNLNQKLNVPFVDQTKTNSKSPTRTQTSTLQHQQLNLSAVSAISSPSTTPVKTNNLMISASPISVASSPTHLNHNPSNNHHATPVNNKNNIINNTSINNNINVISHPENCFYNLNAINKNSLKNMNVNYPSNTMNYLDASSNSTTPNATSSTSVASSTTVSTNHPTQSASSSNHEFPLINQFQQHSHLQQHLLNNFTKSSFSQPLSQQHPTQNTHNQQQMPSLVPPSSAQSSHMIKPAFSLDQYEQMYNYYMTAIKGINQQQISPHHASTQSSNQLGHQVSDLTIPLLSTTNSSPSKANAAASTVAALSKAILESSLTNKI